MSSPRRINPIAAEVQFIPLQAGFYLATLRGTARTPQQIGHFTVPSAQICGLQAPDGKGGRIEMMGPREVAEGWLQQRGDQVVFRVPDGGGQILITTYRAQGTKDSDLDIVILPLTKLMGQSAVAAAPQGQAPGGGSAMPGPAAMRPPARPAAAPLPPQAAAPPVAAPPPPQVLPGLIDVLVHNAMQGDGRAASGAWAGDVQQRRNQLEGFAVTATDGRFPADGITYRAGFTDRRETRWMQLGAYCGTRGQGLGVVGIALKLSPALQQRGLDIEYGVVGRHTGVVTARNGATCRVPDGDVIVGIRVRLVRRGAGTQAQAQPQAQARPQQAPGRGPQPSAAAPRPGDLGAWL